MTKHPRSQRVAIVVGSLRAESLNRKIGKSFAALAGERLDVEFADIGDLPLYNEDLDPTPPAEWVRFREQIAEWTASSSAPPNTTAGCPER